MAQVTDLTVTDVEIIPSRKMEATAFYVGNETIANMAKPISELLFFFPKSDSNNSATVCNPREKVETKQQLAWYGKIKEAARLSAGGPEPATEQELAVLYPAAIEMLKFKNKCIEQVARDAFRHLKVLVSLPERSMKTYVSPESYALLDESEKKLNQVIAAFFDDHNVHPPALEALGTLNPDPDFDYVRVREPSPDAPKDGHPDAKDVEIPR